MRPPVDCSPCESGHRTSGREQDHIANVLESWNME